jgi:hypothetical protein
MKPLAAADLDFFLTTGKQLLNIGKPFYLEGIGTLMQNKEGRLDFVPGEYSTARLQDPATEKREREEKKKTPTHYDEPPREYAPRTNTVRQALLLVGIIGGLVAIGWGGYYLYKRNTFVEPTTENKPLIENNSVAVQDSAHSAADSAKAPGAKDALANKPANAPAQPGSTATPSTTGNIEVPPGTTLYKFVILETVRKGRALRRYNQLLGYQLNIKMDQKDSSYFKLYFPIAAAVRDTTHIKDSLIDVYNAHVRIEH